VVAIGGINENNFMLLKDTGIDGLAIISAILGKKDIIKAASVFVNA
jgi:thiamine-phosphate pyrophosphorylase